MKSKIELAIKEFVQECMHNFGKDLISIVLFGSRVKGYAKKYSDIDLLVIAKNLPEDIRKRFELTEEIEDKIFEKYKLKISPLLFEPEEIFEPINPLLFGVLVKHRVVFGKSMWKKNLKRSKVWVEDLNPTYVEGGREWEVKRLIKL